MRRFKLVEGTSSKFWEIEVAGSDVTTRWGRIGTTGQSKTKAFATPAAAQAEHDALVREKTGKGYREADGAAVDAAAVEAVAQPISPLPPVSSPEEKGTVEEPSSPVSVLPELPRCDHPRRNARAWAPKIDPQAASARIRERWQPNAEPWKVSPSLSDPALGPRLAAVIRILESDAPLLPVGTPDVERLLRSVLYYGDWWQKVSLDGRVVDRWVGAAGLAFAVEALAGSPEFDVASERGGEKRWLVPVQPQRLLPVGGLTDWKRLRQLLSKAPEEEWTAAREAAARLRPGASLHRRALLDYLFPDVAAWCEADAEEALGSQVSESSERLLYSVADGELLRRLAEVGSGHEAALTMVDAAGRAAVPALLVLLAKAGTAESLEQSSKALLLVPNEEVAAALAERLDTREALAALQRLGKDFPRLTLPALAGRTGRGRSGMAAESLLASLVRQSPSVAEELLPGLPEASRRAVQAVRERSAPSVPEAPLDALADPLRLFPAKPHRMPGFWQPVSFSRPLLADRSAALPLAAVEVLGAMLAISRLDEPYAGIAQVKSACDPASLARFAWDLFTAWLTAGSPAKEGWAFQALGHLGDDECARRLAPLIREWPGESAHVRAVAGLDVLRAIGSDVALMHLHGISQKLKFKGLQEKAREKIAEVAEQRGLAPEELADRLVPDLGLEADGSLTLDFGPRAFRIGFDELLRPFVRDAAGKRLPDLPKPVKTDDPEKSKAAQETWKALKKDGKTLAAHQVVRLELAMCGRRRWAPEVFQPFFVEHPLLQHLVRRLVWGVYDGEERLGATFRLSEDGTLADAADETWELPGEARIGIVHRLDLPDDLAAAWGQVLGDYEILQPFQQLGRDVYRATEEDGKARALDRVKGLTLPTGKVLGLDPRGWRRGPALDAGIVGWMVKPLSGDVGTAHEIRLDLDPGIFTGALSEAPEQTLGEVTIGKAGSWESEKALPFGRLDAITFSELVRDLEALR